MRDGTEVAKTGGLDFLKDPYVIDYSTFWKAITRYDWLRHTWLGSSARTLTTVIHAHLLLTSPFPLVDPNFPGGECHGAPNYAVGRRKIAGSV